MDLTKAPRSKNVYDKTKANIRGFLQGLDALLMEQMSGGRFSADEHDATARRLNEENRQDRWLNKQRNPLTTGKDRIYNRPTMDDTLSNVVMDQKLEEDFKKFLENPSLLFKGAPSTDLFKKKK